MNQPAVKAILGGRIARIEPGLAGRRTTEIFLPRESGRCRLEEMEIRAHGDSFLVDPFKDGTLGRQGRRRYVKLGAA